jgi:hypothetical protein
MSNAMSHKPLPPAVPSPAGTDAPASWRRQKKQLRSYYQLHQDLEAIIAAWVRETGRPASEVGVRELFDWSQHRTFGDLTPALPAPKAATGSQGGGQ